MPNSREDYIAYRIGRAWSTFNDAKALADAHSWNSSVNRLYYASFYAVLALFSKHDMNSPIHMQGLKLNCPCILSKQKNLIKNFECFIPTCLTIGKKEITATFLISMKRPYCC